MGYACVLWLFEPLWGCLRRCVCVVTCDARAMLLLGIGTTDYSSHSKERMKERRKYAWFVPSVQEDNLDKSKADYTYAYDTATYLRRPIKLKFSVS